MATNFANNVGHIPENDLKDDLKNIDLKPQQIEKTMKQRNSNKNRFVITDNDEPDSNSSSSEPNSEPSDIDHEEIKRKYDEENEIKMKQSMDLNDLKPTSDNKASENKMNNAEKEPKTETDPNDETIPILKMPKDNNKEPVAD